MQTNAVSSIGEITADGNANINDVNGNNATERGFVWSDESVSLPGSVDPQVSGYEHFSRESGDFGTGSFTGTLNELDRGTKYYVRAWARNEEGYSYGNEVSFTTIDNNSNQIQDTEVSNTDANSVTVNNKDI